MKFKLGICLLISGLVSQLQAFSVHNGQNRTIVLSDFVYHFGSVDIPVNRTVDIEEGETWASNHQLGSTADCTATVGRKKFNFTDLLSTDLITFYLNDNGKLKYNITSSQAVQSEVVASQDLQPVAVAPEVVDQVVDAVVSQVIEALSVEAPVVEVPVVQQEVVAEIVDVPSVQQVETQVVDVPVVEAPAIEAPVVQQQEVLTEVVNALVDQQEEVVAEIVAAQE